MAEIIAVTILIVVAATFLIPQLFSTSANSTDNQAQVTAQGATDAATQWYNRTGALTAMPSNLTKLNADISYVGSSTPSPNATTASVGINTDGTQFVAAVLGTSGCWFAKRTMGALTTKYGSTQYTFTALSSTFLTTSCTATTALTNQASMTSFTSVSTGLFTSCALSMGATPAVYCWGDNSSGQLGTNSVSAAGSPTEVCASSGCTGSAYLTGASSVSVGASSTCAIVSTSIYCWGNNAYGQLGNGTSINQLTPSLVALPAGETPLQVDAGVPSTCALMTDGTVYCWGDNANGELGNGSTSPSTTPVQVTGITNAIQLTTSNTSCALLADHTVRCWGYNADGQVGLDPSLSSNKTFYTTPQTVSGLSNVSMVSSGSSSVCALGSLGGQSGVYCWGDNSFGQLGLSTTTTYSATPVLVSGLTGTPVDVSVGDNFACATTSSPGVYCWGYNGSGQLGVPSLAYSASPQAITNLPSTGINATSISAGAASVCLASADAQLYCWGDGTYGELGNAQWQSSTTPQHVG
jgi:alpha-tubulin suppressor-like RCC1 family protein